MVGEPEAEVEAALELLQVLLRQAPRPPHHRAGRSRRLEHDAAAAGPPPPLLPAAAGRVGGGAGQLRLRGEVGGGGDGRHFCVSSGFLASGLCVWLLGRVLWFPQVGLGSGLFIDRRAIPWVAAWQVSNSWLSSFSCTNSARTFGF